MPNEPALGSVWRRCWEIPGLLLLNWGNHFWNFGLWLQEIWRFYRSWPLFRADLLWMLEYGFKSPFDFSRLFSQEHPKLSDLSVYGETPWTTLDTICQQIGLCSEDRFVDLGCGTGRTLLFVHYRYGCQALGYELVPQFVAKFRWLQHRLKLGAAVDIQERNWLATDLAGTVFFLVGSCYSDAHLEAARQKLLKLPEGSQIVSISYPITGPGIILQEEFQAPFSWGRGTVYIQQKI